MTELGLALALVPAVVRFIPDIENKKPAAVATAAGYKMREN